MFFYLFSVKINEKGNFTIEKIMFMAMIKAIAVKVIMNIVVHRRNSINAFM